MDFYPTPYGLIVFATVAKGFLTGEKMFYHW